MIKFDLSFNQDFKACCKMNNEKESEEIHQLNKKENELKYVLFSFSKTKSNPFELFNRVEKRSKNDESSNDLKLELAMEYELIYNSYFID